MREYIIERLERIEEKVPGDFDFLAKKSFPVPFGMMFGTKRGTEKLYELTNNDESVGYSSYILAGVALACTVLIGFLVAFAGGISAATRPEPTPLNEPQNMLLIPGVNEYIPMGAVGFVFIGMFLSITGHEAMHAIFGSSHGLKVEKWGVFFLGPIPAGAFVDFGEDGIDSLSPVARAEVAGVAPLYNLWLVPASTLLLDLAPSSSRETFRGALGSFDPETSQSFVPLFNEPITNIVFWTMFISLNLFLVNLIPLKPLDGGRVFSAFVEFIGERLGVKESRQSTGKRVVMGVMLLAITTAIAGPYFWEVL